MSESEAIPRALPTVTATVRIEYLSNGQVVVKAEAPDLATALLACNLAAVRLVGEHLVERPVDPNV